MADRSITVKIGANVAGLVSGLKTAAAATKDLASKTDTWVGKDSAHITTLSNGIGLAGAAMTGFAAISVLSAAKFDQAMSSVGAATHESAAGMALLRDAALEAGRSTVYNASESAGAIEELAKAGISTADIVGGGLTGALDLAAAGELAVADAAEIAATAMVQFKLGGEDVGHVADLLAAGAGKAQGGVSDLSMAFKQSGLVASQMGLSIEETTGTLTAFASAGLLGSDAGTSFRTMLLRLANPAANAQREMERLGVSAYDAEGSFVGMSDLAGQLVSALKPLPQAQRDAALATIFGSDAIRAANVLYDQGADGIDGWITAVDDAGYAAITASTRLDNLAGDWEQLGGAVETALIGMGDGAQGPLRSLVQGVTDVVDAFSELPDPVQQSTLAIVGGGGLVLLGIAGMGRLAVQIHEARGAMQALGISAKTAGLAVAGVTTVIAVAAIGFSTWAENAAKASAKVDQFRATLDETTGATTELTRAMIAEALAADRGFNPMQGRSYQSMADGAKHLGIELDTLTDAILGDADALEIVNAKVDDAWDIQYRGATGAIEAGHKTADSIEAVQWALSSQSGALNEAKEQYDQITEAMGDAATASDESMSATERYTAAAADGAATTELFNDALDEHITKMSEAAGVVLTERDAQRGYQQALLDATQSLKDNGATLDITKEAGIKNGEALDEIARAGYRQVESMYAAGRSQEELQGHLDQTRQDLISTAMSFGMTEDEAIAYADSLDLIPGSVYTVVDVDTANAMAKIGAVQSALSSLGIPGGSLFGIVSRAAGIGKADGGFVSGPGTSTSDSIPAWLSNGEYVMRSAAVDRYGIAMMDAINSGRWTVGTPPPARMASGGAVASRPVGPLVQIGQVVAYDAADAARRIADRQRDVLVSHGLVGTVL